MSKQRSAASRQRASLKGQVKKPFGPWEKRLISEVHPMRPRGVKWREECFLNNRYSVQVSDDETSWGTVVHLWVRRHVDGMPRRWSDLQRIKNEIIGKERVAIEVFPPESELHDSADMSHLWVLPEDFVLPFRLK